MITEVFQVCHWLAKLAAAGLLDLVLQYVSKSEAQSEAHLSVSSVTLSGLPVELIGEIVGHLDSASLHNLRNTTKWLAAAVEYNYTKRHPTLTVCRDARQLPGFLKQLTMPAISMHIKSLKLSGVSAKAYPEFPSMFYLPHLKRLVLKGLVMNSTSLLNICSSHQATLRSLKIDHVYLKKVGHWEVLLFQILVLLQLRSLQARGLLYKSGFTGFLSKVYLPIEGRINVLEGLPGRI